MSGVLLDARARDVMDREAVQRRLRESGGSLFGWENDDHIVIACASGPGPKARHRPRSFQPAPGTTASVMKAVAESSASRYGYLGSWHTHPLAAAVPSAIDRGTAEAMAAQTDLLLPEPLLLILSTTGTSRRVVPADLRAWRWQKDERVLREMPVGACQLTERFCPPRARLFMK
jgi:integrative and conjugative element protein (TIGR02256 family)